MARQASPLDRRPEVVESSGTMSLTASREPKQTRSRRSFEQVVVAATEILAEAGYEGLTLNDVSRRSRVSIGAIYGRVSGKDELVQIVQRRVLDMMEAEQSELLAPQRWQNLSLGELTPALVADLAEHLRRWAPLLRAFMLRAPHDEIIGAAGRASAVRSAARAQHILLLPRQEIRRADPQRAAAACYTVIYSTFSRFLGLGVSLEAAGGGDWDQLKDDVSEMCRSFLASRDAS